MVVDQVPQHVQVLLIAVHRGDLDRGHRPQSVLGRRFERLLHAIHGVVIAQSQELDPGAGGGRHHVLGGQRAIRVNRVALKVKRRRLGAQGAERSHFSDH